MNTKRNITGVLSLVVLLLLPAFAGAGERKAVKKTELPKLDTNSTGFRAFNSSTKSDGYTTRGNVEDSVPSGGQSVGGAGVMSGVDTSQGAWASQNKGSNGSGTSGGSSGAGGAGVSPGIIPTDPTAQSCSWISEISPTPALYPALPCSSSNEGAVSPNSQNQGSFTCICDNSGGDSSAGAQGSGSTAGSGDPDKKRFCAARDTLPGSIFYVDWRGTVQEEYFLNRAACHAIRSDLGWDIATPEGAAMYSRLKRDNEGAKNLLRERGLLDVVDANRQLMFSVHLTGANGVLSSADGGLRVERNCADGAITSKYVAVIRGISKREHKRVGLDFNMSPAHTIGEAAWNKYGNDVESGRLTLDTLALIRGVTVRRIRSK